MAPAGTTSPGAAVPGSGTSAAPPGPPVPLPPAPAARPARGPRRPRLARLWGETWRILAAAVFGFFVSGFVAYEASIGDRDMSGGRWALDFVLGIASLALLPLRRRAPTVVALVVSAVTAFSVTAAGTEAIVAISLATHRRWWRIAAVGVVFVGAGTAYEWLNPVEAAPSYPLVLNVVIMVGVYALLVWIGAYIGLRREHLASLRERAETAEREQASRVAQARANERSRIAREMHDVLAHRMSLVAMHAGALAYRTDLPPAKVAETAAVVQSSAHAALEELREVLGVLRSTDGEDRTAADHHPERPQPTLADLDELVAEARAGGTQVQVERLSADLAGLPVAVSRNAFRIVQEALTNARKHAPWAPVTVTVWGAPGDGLSLTVRNPLRTVGPTPAELPPVSGLGLVGLTERAELSGGRFSYGERGGQFVVSAWLPWAP
ncbi:hypothetical protein DNL40_08690 [Xylanimonas oleitrophica]|uniref:histidine kinase n=1 Tax=Xylanimonas oleitrophica TaxID=2607479 RepID=A0A2W5WXP3_9MICO|nr:histidine kinase [Xylanimonas oleitrophica]PZR53076.1 hypothetical protein DNL40_08690 [Xylanimonas oleitrophica]